MVVTPVGAYSPKREVKAFVTQPLEIAVVRTLNPDDS